MGRPPCCDKVGVKKGPWTPEEDIILVSYIQEHGPGNWRSVPTNTGLLRCSKSCRLRWTNYLRPGIKRGNFTPHEEGMIIHLQALLGNKWAAIASYLPQRTDNDIKNYWNTHLKKKLNKFHSTFDHHNSNYGSLSDHSTHRQIVANVSGSFSETRKAFDMTCENEFPDSKNISLENASSTSNSSSTYASSTENIARLLQGWMRTSPKTCDDSTNIQAAQVCREQDESTRQVQIKTEEPEGKCCNLVPHKEFESILLINESSNTSDCMPNVKSSSVATEDNDEIKVKHVIMEKNSQGFENPSGTTTPLSLLFEKWLFDENSTATTTGHVEEMVELSSMF